MHDIGNLNIIFVVMNALTGLDGLVKPLSLYYSLTDDTIHIDTSAN
jgi:hypothetical protein